MSGNKILFYFILWLWFLCIFKRFLHLLNNNKFFNKTILRSDMSQELLVLCAAAVGAILFCLRRRRRSTKERFVVFIITSLAGYFLEPFVNRSLGIPEREVCAMIAAICVLPLSEVLINSVSKIDLFSFLKNKGRK